MKLIDIGIYQIVSSSDWSAVEPSATHDILY